VCNSGLKMPDNNNNKASHNKQSKAVKRKNKVNDGTASTEYNGNKNQNENSNSQTDPPSKKQKVVQFNGIFNIFNNLFFCRC